MIERIQHDVYPFISPSAGLRGSASGKTVLVTGGSMGIGRVCVLFVYFGLVWCGFVSFCASRCCVAGKIVSH